MPRKLTVGARIDPEDKSAGKTALKTAVEIAASEKTAAAEKFPTDLKQAFALLATVNAEQVSTAEEWEEKQPRLKALKVHIHKLQQGLPLVETKSGDINHAHMTEVMGGMKLALRVKAYPEVAAVVAERDALKKANLEMAAVVAERDAEIVALKAQIPPKA